MYNNWKETLVMINQKVLKKIKNKLKEEGLHEKELKLFEEFAIKETSSINFIDELEIAVNKMKEKGHSLQTELHTNILTCIMLGLGRDRTINLFKEENVTRNIYEKIRNASKVMENNITINNAKFITELKWESKTRDSRKQALSKVNWEDIKSRYLAGESPAKLGEEYKVSGHIITMRLIDENLFDETRSTITKSKLAEKQFNSIDDNYIINLVEKNPLDSKEVLWKKSQEKYPWLLRRQFYNKLQVLNLERSKDEINAIKSIKSKVPSNTDYLIKMNGYKAVKQVFGNVDNLVKQYMENTLGSYNKIANTINNTINFDYEISARQVEKIITKNENYKPRQSSGQKQLFTFIKKTFPELKIEEEFSFNNTQQKIDIYIPELKIGFEYNGDYWHSDEVIKYNYGKTAKKFHAERAKEVKEMLNAKLMYVWENDWNQNYNVIETAIINKDWNNPILNKYENVTKRSGNYKAPDQNPSLLRNQIMRFLKEKQIKYDKDNSSHLINLLDFNIIINVPNYNSLTIKHNCLNLQRYYEEQNIELITILPWSDIYKIKQFLTYRLELKTIEKIGARKCEIEITDGISNIHKMFFANNHILGYYNFQHIDKTVLLKYKEEIVMAALFTRKPGEPKAELKRLVTKQGLSIQGGASKLLKAYIENSVNLKEIYTFSDCDLGLGNIYKTLNFELIERSGAQLTWYNEELEKQFSNISLVTVGADRLLRNLPNYEPVGVGEGLPSNQEIVQSYGFIPIYDSGYKKWLLKL